MRTFNYSGSRQSGDSRATRPFPVALDDVLKEAAIIHTTAFIDGAVCNMSDM